MDRKRFEMIDLAMDEGLVAFPQGQGEDDDSLRSRNLHLQTGAWVLAHAPFCEAGVAARLKHPCVHSTNA